MSYDSPDGKFRPLPKPKRTKLIRKVNHLHIGFHVCVPLYRQIPKEKQTGWTQMGAHGVQEWDNTTNITEYVLRYGKDFDHGLYCGVCGRKMTKGRNQTKDPRITGEAKEIKLV